MAAVPGMYTPLKWWAIDDDRLIFECLNWCDNPEPGGAPIGFPSMQSLQYAGNGQFKAEEDWWVLREAQRAAKDYADACARFDPDHPSKMTRDDWGQWVDWARPDPTHPTNPSWLGRPDVVPVLRPAHLNVGIRNP